MPDQSDRHGDQVARAVAFSQLHDGPEPLRLVNAWDALSARTFALAGAPAVATSSFAVAFAHGYQDGQHIEWETVCQTVAAITAAVDVPVTVDVEAGHGASPADVSRTVADVLAAGAVGINLEDSQPNLPGQLFDQAAQGERIAAACSCADAAGVPLYVNARCDVFFGAAVPPERQRDEALARIGAYVEAGADGVFLPGLNDLDALREVTRAVPVPVNVMVWPGLPPIEDLAKAGIRRISQGAAAFLLAVAQFEKMTQAYLEGPLDQFGGDLAPALHLLPGLAYR